MAPALSLSLGNQLPGVFVLLGHLSVRPGVDKPRPFLSESEP